MIRRPLCCKAEPHPPETELKRVYRHLRKDAVVVVVRVRSTLTPAHQELLTTEDLEPVQGCGLEIPDGDTVTWVCRSGRYRGTPRRVALDRLR